VGERESVLRIGIFAFVNAQPDGIFRY
jgi:hypothetical protein